MALITDKEYIRKQLIYGSLVRISSCQEWIFGVDTGGYGYIKINGKMYGTHRLAMYIHKEFDINSDKKVLHTCDNPPCINVDHLYIGTHQDNMNDMIKRNRHVSGSKEKSHCPQGHEFIEENIYRRPDNPNHRGCKACRNESNKARPPRWKN